MPSLLEYTSCVFNNFSWNSLSIIVYKFYGEHYIFWVMESQFYFIISDRELLLMEAVEEIRATQRQQTALLQALVTRQQLEATSAARDPIVEAFNLPLTTEAALERLDKLIRKKKPHEKLW